MAPTDPTLIAFAFLLGAAIGSFLNVCIYRLPAGQSVVAPRSHCQTCSTPIRWYDNLPLLSYLWLRGRCRACGTHFAARYMLIELLAALLSVALMARFGPSFEYLGYLYFACALLAITYIDLDHQIIPDVFTKPGIVIGLALALVAPHGDLVGSFTRSLLGALLGGGILWAIAWTYEKVRGQEGMGFGDVKLLAMIGAFLGWQAVLLTILLASFVGATFGVAMMLSRGANSKLALPFGPFLSLGALLALFWGRQIVSWYISQLSAGAI